jgi:hypothetical protein
VVKSPRNCVMLTECSAEKGLGKREGSKQKHTCLMRFCHDPQTGQWVCPPCHGLGAPGVRGGRPPPTALRRPTGSLCLFLSSLSQISI